MTLKELSHAEKDRIHEFVMTRLNEIREEQASPEPFACALLGQAIGLLEALKGTDAVADCLLIHAKAIQRRAGVVRH